MTQRMNLAGSIFAMAAGFSALILLAEKGEGTTSKTRLFLSLVKPLVESVGSSRAIGLLMAVGVLGGLAILLWPSSKRRAPGKVMPAPRSSRKVKTDRQSPSPASVAPRKRSIAALAGAEASQGPGAIPQGHELAQQIANAMQAELDRLDGLREERANSGPPKPGIGEARHRPIVFCQQLLATDGTWLSYYGGRPTVPPGFAWPVSANDPARPIHFLMQWDCRQLANEDATGLLPRDGVLYCFIDYVDGSPFDGRFVYAAGPTDGWQELDPPASLGPVHGAQQFPYCTLRSDAGEQHLPALLPRWNFQPVAIDYPIPTPSSADVDDPEEQGWFWNDRSGVGEELLKAQARTVGPARKSEDRTPGGVARPFPRFPHDWAAVRILATKAVDGLSSPSVMRKDVLPAEDERTKQQLVAQWKEQANELFAFAARHDLSAAVPQDIADDVWAWCETVAPALRLGFDRTVEASVNSSLGLGSAARDAIPSAWIERIATHHALAFDYIRDEYPDHSLPDPYKAWEEKKARGELQRIRNLHAPCPNRTFGPPSYVQGYVEEYVLDHLLLLEMSSTHGIDFHLGDGVIQFMITPEDLRERRFDKVMTIASAY